MFNKENNKLSCHHGALALTIAVLLGFILIVLVFKVGVMVGGSGSHFSACDYHKNYSGYADKKFISLKKSYSSYKTAADYSSYKVVTELTGSGFIVKGGDGKLLEVVVGADTKIYGAEKTGAKVIVGDKVYVTGSTNESGQVVAAVVKIFNLAADKLKK